MADSPQSLLSLWPPEDLAVDLGIKESRVRKWSQRGSIPAAYWSALVAAARRRGFGSVSLEALASMHAARPTDRRRGIPEVRP